MIDNKTILSIIPARKGSKGILNKNIKELGGKPLISWTIIEAKKSKFIDRLIITTDSDEIAKIGREEGAEIPFIRPAEISQDNSTATEVILHTLQWFYKNDKSYDYFIYLQPTSPLRKVDQIDQALKLIISDERSDSLVSVSAPSKHPYWMKRINNNGFLEDFFKTDKLYNNRQELPQVYTVNGAIYISKWDVFLEDNSFYKGNCLPFIIEGNSSIDLDTIDDWNYAEYMIRIIINDNTGL